jgi:CRISPR-associated protein Cmr3
MTSHPIAQQWRFTALDTLFFRESRPMEAIGGAQLQSVFPPPARTLIGAIRTAVGQAHDVDWKSYANDKNAPLRAIIGSPESLGPLSFAGPFLLKDNERLYPVPLALLQASASDKAGVAFTRLEPAEAEKAIMSDLGKLRLPTKRDALDKAKPMENASITAAGLQAFLGGGMPDAKAIIPNDDLYDSEERLGIGRDNDKRTVQEGLLYQTNHVRPKHGVSIGIVVKGLATDNVPETGTTRLGAEGRLASWQREAIKPLPAAKSNGERIMLLLLTHARFQHGWLPDGFEKKTIDEGQTVWDGEIQGVALRLISAVVGKPLREGGWDLVSGMPRTMDSLVPAGSCYFFEKIGGDAGKLNGLQIGLDTDHGRGEIAIGTW